MVAAVFDDDVENRLVVRPRGQCGVGSARRLSIFGRFVTGWTLRRSPRPSCTTRDPLGDKTTRSAFPSPFRAKHDCFPFPTSGSVSEVPPGVAPTTRPGSRIGLSLMLLAITSTVMRRRSSDKQGSVEPQVDRRWSMRSWLRGTGSAEEHSWRWPGLEQTSVNTDLYPCIACCYTAV